MIGKIGVGSKQVVFDDSALNAYKANDTKQITIKHKILIMGIPYTTNFDIPIGDDVHRIGFLVETCSIEGFVHNAEKWKTEFDVIVLANTAIPYYSTVTPSELKTSVKLFMDYGVKVIWLHNAPTLRFEKLRFDGYKDTEVLVNDLFSTGLTCTAVNMTSTNGTIAHSVSYGLDKEVLVPNLLVYNSVLPNYATSDISVLLPITATNGTVTSKVMAIKKGKFAIIAYGGLVVGDNMGSATFKYIDYANLILELLNMGANNRLAIDSLYGRKVAGIGIDADITTESPAIENLLNAIGLKYPVQIGVVTSKITEALALWYRGLNARYPNISLCSHTANHYGSASLYTVTDEVYTIPVNSIVTLKKPFKVMVTSIKSNDGTIIFTETGTSLKHALPSDTQYSLQKTSDNEMIDGRIKFSVANAGIIVKISYTYRDDFIELVKSINDLITKGCMDEKTVFLTMGANSVSSAVMKLAEQQGITLCDYLGFPNNYRAWTLVDSVYNKFPYLNGVTMSPDGQNGSDDINLLKKHTKAEVKTTVFPAIVARALSHETPFIGYIHDIPIAEEYTGSVWNSAEFNADWKKATFVETLAYVQEFYTWMFDQINTNNTYWTTRGKYTEFYQYVNKHLIYDAVVVDGRTLLYVRNTGGKALNGLTFRVVSAEIPTSVKILKDELIPFTFSNGTATLWFDLPAGASFTIEVMS